MKLTCLLVLFFTFQMSASVWSQTMNLKLKNSTLQELFLQIEKSSNYRFFYNNDEVDVNHRVTVFAEGKTVAKILETAFEGMPYSFKELENKVILIERTNLPAKGVSPNSQQQKSISGKVTDASGASLPGVSVVVKGTTTGVITDMDGKYTLPRVPEKATLQFSFVGMKTQEIAIGIKTTINVAMEDETVVIEEVVAIGYGTQKKSDVTGSIASVKGDDVVKKGNLSTTQALQGIVAGVTVANTSGKPGSSSSIVIRGQGSYGDTNPLYIVDGVVASNIDFIDPNDIASLEILKDASSAAIYGSRAANGVVILTTKRGKSGQSKIVFTANYGVQSMSNKLDLASSQQWRDKEVWKYNYEGKAIPEKLKDGVFDPSVSTDWQDVVFRNAPQQNYHLSFSGGGKNNNFNFSIGYSNQEGIVVESGYDRINIRMNSDFSAGKFKFGESLSISRSNTKGSNNVTYYQSWPIPAFSPKDADGNYQVMGSGYGSDVATELQAANPLAYCEINDRNVSDINTIANVYGLFNIAEGLFIKTSGNVELINSHLKTFLPGYQIGHVSNTDADLNESRYESNVLLWENTLNYKRVFGDHTIDAVAGWSRQLETSSGITLMAEGFPVGITQAYAAETILPVSSGTKNESSLESFLGRVNYSYKGRYLLTASVRQDASSRLIKSLRTDIFPSFSLGWVASDESFFPKNSFINRLKFRGGYGELGRLNSVGVYQTQNTLSLGGYNIDYIIGRDQHFANGISISNIVNSEILWERAKSTNIAMELSMLDNKIFLNAEYFNKNTEDLQFGAPIPLSVGTIASSILVNAGNIQNKGFELTLGYSKKKGEFTFDASVNLFKLTNKVISFNNPGDVFVGGMYGFEGQNATRAEVGREMSNFWLLHTDGIFKSQEEVLAHNKDGVLIQPFAKPGDLRFVDYSGDGKINADDKQYISGSIPDLEYGINFSSSYKNFDFSLLIQGVTGAKLFNGVSRVWDGILASPSTDYWREDNIDANYYRPSVTDPNANRGDNDFYLENSAYLRLKNIQLGYKLPSGILSVLNLKTVRVNVTGQNLLTFTKFTGYDPENVSFGLSRGVNTNVYPLAKTILFGLSVEF